MSAVEIQKLFQGLWDPYYRQNPQVPEVYRLLTEREQTESLYNDHIALRTFQLPKVGLEVLANPFTRLGFVEKESFHLTDKHVFAKYYSHPSGKWPRVFISELLMDSLTQEAQQMIEQLVAQIPEELITSQRLCFSGRPWDISYLDYQILLAESEYASWMAAHGFQMNHATVSVNSIKTFKNLEALDAFLREHHFVLNGASQGKEIQQAIDGEGRVILKQSSTIASRVTVPFSDGSFEVPGCYYEFIERFHGYDSFDPGNASKIMESTNAKRAN